MTILPTTANWKSRIAEIRCRPVAGYSRGQPAIRLIYFSSKAMKCSDLQFNLSLYVDGAPLGENESDALHEHLAACPLCRQKHSDLREIRLGLMRLRRPEISAELRQSLKRSVRGEAQTTRHSWLPVSTDIRELLQMRVMPLATGVLASFIVGLSFLTLMFSGMLDRSPISPAGAYSNDRVMLASNSKAFKDGDGEQISPSDYARTRLGLASESPSINPQGALIALTRSLVRGGMKDDEVVVVADVFSNGLAQIAEVVEPSRDTKAVGELEKALESDPAFSPFVSSSVESRPSSVRVVLKFQSVDVSTRQHHRRK